MNRKFVIRCLYALFGLLTIAFLVKEASSNGDFKVYLEAAKLISVDKSPYKTWIYISEGHYCLYYYSPLWAVVLIPFSDLPHFIPNLIWLTINIWFLIRIVKLLEEYHDEKYLFKKELTWIFLLTCVLSIRFILYNFDLVQMTIFLLWGSLESLRLMKTNNSVPGGCLLALIINIKILPIVIIPYLLYRGYLKGVLSTIVFSAAFLIVPAAFIGWSENLHLVDEWWSVINPSNSEHLIESDLGPHSLTALIPSLLLENNGDLPYTRNIMTITRESAIIVLNIVRTALVLLTFYFLKLPPFTNAKSKLDELREIGYILIITPLIFPHQQKYEFVFAIPAMFYLIYFIFHEFNKNKMILNKLKMHFTISLVISSFILMTLSTDGIIGIDLNRITQHYKTVTWGTLLLVIALMTASPNHNKQVQNFS